MSRSWMVLTLLLVAATTASPQSVPKELLLTPTHLELDKPTTEVKAGSNVTYTVTLKNPEGDAVPASSNLQLDIETPSGPRNALLLAGQSTASFTLQAEKSGIGHITVRSGKLHPASGLVLVTPTPIQKPSRIPPVPMGGVPPSETKLPRRHPPTTIGVGPEHGVIGSMAGAGAGGAPQPSPLPATVQATKIQLYVEPLPIYGNPVEHIWKAKVSVAALGERDSLAPVSADTPVHLHASSGHLEKADIVLGAGQISNFEHPVELTADRGGKGIVDAVSSLGLANAVQIEYLQPPPKQLRLSLGTPVLTGSGSSTVSVQVCLLDESGAITSSGQDTQVTLTAPGQVAPTTVTIRGGSSCSDLCVWTAGSGLASIRAEAPGLDSDIKSITFPSFPWHFVWLAAAGGLVGALISQWGDLFSARWWAHTWRSLVLGAVVGVFFYLLALFGAIALPKDSPINIQKIPAVSAIGSLLLGFVGGLYGRKVLGQTKPPEAK